MTCTGHTPEFVPVDSMREFARAMVMSSVKDIIFQPCTGSHFYSAVRFLLGNGNPYIYELCETFVAIPDLGEVLHKRKQMAREKPKLTAQEADIVRILVRNNKDMPAEDLRKLATERLGKSVSLAQIGEFRSRKGKGVVRLGTEKGVEALKDARLEVDRRGLVRDFVRSHPDMGRRELADAATRELGFWVTPSMVDGHRRRIREEE